MTQKDYVKLLRSSFTDAEGDIEEFIDRCAETLSIKDTVMDAQEAVIDTLQKTLED